VFDHAPFVTLRVLLVLTVPDATGSPVFTGGFPGGGGFPPPAGTGRKLLATLRLPFAFVADT
jgi:hypothetical protein